MDEAIAALHSAEDHALDPKVHGPASLIASRTALAERASSAGDRRRELAEFDVRMTHALLKLGRAVALGQTSPATVDSRWRKRRHAPAFPELLAKTLDESKVREWLARVQPAHAEYRALQKAWRSLARRRDSVWPIVPPIAVAPGQRHPSVAVLRARLAAGGELGAAGTSDPQRYDAALQQAVRAFQEHHGLKPTGVVDAPAQAALNVPSSQRLRQIALNLERWRWMPDDLGANHVRVNIPSFYLDVHEDARSVLSIRTVVGKVGDETPVFSDAMTHIVFSPYWNIPESIVTEETVPGVARDPDYLERHNIEVVRVSGDRVEPIDPKDMDWSDAGAVKAVTFRQRPGADNALGFVKFLFPNPFDIYIHDTPADGLFARRGRLFSHGCIRIEDPAALATYVLRDQPEWTRPAIEEAMHAGVERHVKLTRTLPVHVVYFTAWADEQGGVHFREDVYGLDARQSEPAGRRSSAAPAPAPAKPEPRT